MNTHLATLMFAAALGVSGVAIAAEPDAHSQHHPATPPAAAAQTPAPQTPPAGAPGMDCKAMMGNGMMGANGMMGSTTSTGGAMQGGAMQGGDKAAGGAPGQPMANGMMDHCMNPAASDKGAVQTPPPAH
jgi:hypothetical protein